MMHKFVYWFLVQKILLLLLERENHFMRYEAVDGLSNIIIVFFFYSIKASAASRREDSGDGMFLYE